MSYGATRLIELNGKTLHQRFQEIIPIITHAMQLKRPVQPAQHSLAVGNLTGKQDTLSLRGSAGAGEDLKLIINARVETTPELLDQMVREVLIGMIDGKYEEEVVAWRFLQPGRPNPTHRFVEIVKS